MCTIVYVCVCMYTYNNKNNDNNNDDGNNYGYDDDKWCFNEMKLFFLPLDVKCST